MKANELMIGDWVQSKHDKFKMQVSAIFDNVVQVQTDYMKEGQWYSEAFIDEIEPIPLTPEILEKNGFIKLSRHCHGTPLQYCVLVDGLWIDISGENFFEGKLDYIHQLQHVLRLCGIDKTIEL